MKSLVVIVVLFLLAAAACGGAESNAPTSSGGADRAQPVTNAGSGSTSGHPAAGAAQPGSTTTGGGSTLPADNVPTLTGPPVIRQAQLSISVGPGTFASKLSDVRAIVEAEGGYIAGTDAQASPTVDNQDTQIRTGVLNFMVPAARFDSTIDDISKVGTLRGEHITGTDVSAQYVDLNARLANAEAQHEVYLALLAKATNTNDIIAIENQIGQITAQIEQLKGQIKYLDQYTAFSTITVTMTEVAPPAQATTTSDSWGFATALNEAAHNFVTTINYAVSGLGAVGPFLALALLGFLVWRRRRAPQPKHA